MPRAARCPDLACSDCGAAGRRLRSRRRRQQARGGDSRPAGPIPRRAEWQARSHRAMGRIRRAICHNTVILEEHAGGFGIKAGGVADHRSEDGIIPVPAVGADGARSPRERTPTATRIRSATASSTTSRASVSLRRWRPACIRETTFILQRRPSTSLASLTRRGASTFPPAFVCGSVIRSDGGRATRSSSTITNFAEQDPDGASAATSTAPMPHIVEKLHDEGLRTPSTGR